MTVENQQETMAASHCPMLRFVDLIAGKWAIPILYRLIVLDRPVRFGELQRGRRHHPEGVDPPAARLRAARPGAAHGVRRSAARVSTGSPRWAARCSSRCSSWRMDGALWRPIARLSMPSIVLPLGQQRQVLAMRPSRFCQSLAMRHADQRYRIARRSHRHRHPAGASRNAARSGV